jgi:hypothetical protein
MSEVPFHATKMGHTVPDIAKQITRLADALERLADTESAGAERVDEPETPDKDESR